MIIKKKTERQILVEAIEKRHEDIKERGEAAVKTGNLKLFGGFESQRDMMSRRITVAAIFTENFENHLKDMTLRFLRVAKNYGDMYLATRDFKLHATLAEADIVPESSASVPFTIDSPLYESALSTAGAIFGLKSERGIFGRLIFDGTNIILAAKALPPCLLEVRSELERQFVENGMKPRPSLDILFYAILGRMIRPPDDMKRFMDLLFMENYAWLEGCTPIDIEKVYVGDTYSLVGQPPTPTPA